MIWYLRLVAIFLSLLGVTSYAETFNLTPDVAREVVHRHDATTMRGKKAKKPPKGWFTANGFAATQASTDVVVQDEPVVTANNEVEKPGAGFGWGGANGFFSRGKKVKQSNPQPKDQLFAVSVPKHEWFEHALFADVKTGVRQELLLAILGEESAFGTNFGTGRYNTDMNPKQWGCFFQVMSTLGLDPKTTPVSADPGKGSGGAMGWLQQIPCTWQRNTQCVMSALNKTKVSPWDPRDAMFAAACELKRHGAALRTLYAEKKSALKYYAGDNWNSKSSFVQSYWRRVYKRLRKIEILGRSKNVTLQRIVAR